MSDDAGIDVTTVTRLGERIPTEAKTNKVVRIDSGRSHFTKYLQLLTLALRLLT